MLIATGPTQSHACSKWVVSIWRGTHVVEQQRGWRRPSCRYERRVYVAWAKVRVPWVGHPRTELDAKVEGVSLQVECHAHDVPGVSRVSC